MKRGSRGQASLEPGPWPLSDWVNEARHRPVDGGQRLSGEGRGGHAQRLRRRGDGLVGQAGVGRRRQVVPLCLLYTSRCV